MRMHRIHIEVPSENGMVKMYAQIRCAFSQWTSTKVFAFHFQRDCFSFAYINIYLALDNLIALDFNRKIHTIFDTSRRKSHAKFIVHFEAFLVFHFYSRSIWCMTHSFQILFFNIKLFPFSFGTISTIKYWKAHSKKKFKPTNIEQNHTKLKQNKTI